MSKPLIIRLSWSIVEAEKLNLFNLDAKHIVENSSEKKALPLFENPVFSKERFFVVKGTIGDRECCGNEPEDWWNYCPECGNSLDDEEIVNEVHRTIEKARESEHAIELGIKDIYVVLVQEQKDVIDGSEQ